MFEEFPFKVIDNFLSEKYFSLVREQILSIDFPWYFRDNITNNSENSNLKEYGFSHKLYDSENGYSSFFNPVLSGIYGDILSLTEHDYVKRSRLDMTTFMSDKFLNHYHVDSYDPHIACIFYITDSDGETVIYNKQCFSEQDLKNTDSNSLGEIIRITPKENRIIFFDGSYLHTGHSPSKYKRRVLLNVNVSS